MGQKAVWCHTRSYILCTFKQRKSIAGCRSVIRRRGREGGSKLAASAGLRMAFPGYRSVPSLPPRVTTYSQDVINHTASQVNVTSQSHQNTYMFVVPHSQILVSSLCIHSKPQSESHCNGFSLAFPGLCVTLIPQTRIQGTYFCIGPTDHYIKLTSKLPKIPAVPCCRVCPLMSYNLITSTMH